MPKTNVVSKPAKPKKPYKDFPLFAHATRRWAKKIRGKTCYFGPWDDPEGALRRYLQQKDALYSGRRPPPNSGEGITVRDAVNRFLTAKERQMESGEITQLTFSDYHRTCARIVAVFSKTRLVDELVSGDFEQLHSNIAKKRGPVALGNEITRVRVVFNYVYKAELIDRPVKFGPVFKRPSKEVLRKVRNSRGPRMFEAAEIRALLAAVSTQWKAMILLGVNCGFANSDVGRLNQAALDLKGGWVTFPRPKTGVQRRCPLWLETIYELRETIRYRQPARRQKDADLVFITKYGSSWAKETHDNPISKEMRKIQEHVSDESNGSLQSLYVKGRGFRAFRHTFETIAGGTRDQAAVDHIMGYERDDMETVYRERISDERLIAVTGFVHHWLFSDEPKAESPT